MEDPEALESLLTHPGWRAFEAYVLGRWGRTAEPYVAMLEGTQALTDTDLGELHRQQVIACAKLAAALLAWPREELARAQRATRPQDPSVSRRGGL